MWRISGNAGTRIATPLEYETRSDESLPETQLDQPSDFAKIISDLTHTNQNNGSELHSDLNHHLEVILKQFQLGQFETVASYINENYSNLSTYDLDQIRVLYLKQRVALYKIGDRSGLYDLYTSKANVFDDLESWTQLANAAIEKHSWATAYEALLKASLLENDGTQLEKKLSSLVKVTANLRAQYEQQGDSIGVHELYEDLYNSHPSFGRFQLELAYSFLRLKQDQKARTLLIQLQYDVKLGAISKDVLAKLDQNRKPVPQKESTISANQRHTVTIPIERYGTNMLVSMNVNRKPISLLLDTGASITALDTQLIKRLRLRKTGQVIQISTANGIRDAALYQVQSLQLGQFKLRDFIVAEIDLGGNQRFSGLLGTDLLNSLNNEYSYVIDNAKSALIFSPN